MDDKAFKGIMVGYSNDSPGYMIYNPATMRTIVTKHVRFDETFGGRLRMEGALAKDTREEETEGAMQGKGGALKINPPEESTSPKKKEAPIDSGEDKKVKGPLEREDHIDNEDDELAPEKVRWFSPAPILSICE